MQQTLLYTLTLFCNPCPVRALVESVPSLSSSFFFSFVLYQSCPVLHHSLLVGASRHELGGCCSVDYHHPHEQRQLQRPSPRKEEHRHGEEEETKRDEWIQMDSVLNTKQDGVTRLVLDYCAWSSEEEVGDEQNNNNNIDRVELCWGWMARHRQGDRRGVVEQSSHRLVSMAPVSLQLSSWLCGCWGWFTPRECIEKSSPTGAPIEASLLLLPGMLWCYFEPKEEAPLSSTTTSYCGLATIMEVL